MASVQRMNYRKTRLGEQRGQSRSPLQCCRADGVVAWSRLLMKMLRSGLDLRNICHTCLGLDVRDEGKRAFYPELVGIQGYRLVMWMNALGDGS